MKTKERHKKHRTAIFFLIMILFFTGTWRSGLLGTVSAAQTLSIPAKSVSDRVNVRKKAGTDQEQLMSGKTKVTLKKNQEVTILGESIADGEKWYQISFQLAKKKVKGYVHSDYITLTLKRIVGAKVKSKGAVPIKTGAGRDKAALKIKGKAAFLKDGASCQILKEVTASAKKWFQIKFTMDKKDYKGYIEAGKLRLQADSGVKTQTGTVNATNVNVRVDAGTDKMAVAYKDKKVKLSKGQKVTILGEKEVDKVVWYQVTFAYEQVNLSGYVSGDFVLLDSGKEPEPSESPEAPPEPTRKPDAEKPPAPDPGATPSPTAKPPVELSDEAFEQALAQQAFPEDYKPALRLLHEQYPMWQFKAMHTGLSWPEVISYENRLGMNLITNNKSIAWKSTDSGAYNWSSDRFIPFDGSTWVTASREALEYYMDPRNFLMPDGIFQFEILSYNSSYQNLAGVENILSGTPLSNGNVSATDEFGNAAGYTYGEIFMKAAEYSGVNPYHLASRVKQEVITSSGLSASVSGMVSGYENLYNFYNIGANDSTVPGGNIANGLKFARDGKGTSEANKALLLLPWSNPYNSIVGGAKYIGNNYINRGQENVYLQKFNVTPSGTYGHQYMSNVEAPKAEAQKIYLANKSFTDVPTEFSIPVYLDMPASSCPVPVGGENPNNWLSSLTLSEGALMPAFRAADPEGTIYSATVGAEVDSVTITAAAASKLATVAGDGEIFLNPGSNRIIIRVTAQNQTARSYTVEIIKQDMNGQEIVQ